MFEELNQHRAAVAEQIQKAMEIGFTDNELEKAHKVGDIHPNGKWVWTQLPSGKYDWRVIKKTGAPSGGSVPAGQGKKEDHITISPNHPALGALKGVPNMRVFLETFDSKYKDLGKVEVMRTPKGNWDVHYDGHRLGIMAGASIPEGTAKKMGWLKTDAKDFTRSERDAEEEAKKMKGGGDKKLSVDSLKNDFDSIMSAILPMIESVEVSKPVGDDDSEVYKTYKVSEWKKGVHEVGSGFYGKSDLLELATKRDSGVDGIQLRKYTSNGYGGAYKDQPVGHVIVEVLKNQSWHNFDMKKDGDREALVKFLEKAKKGKELDKKPSALISDTLQKIKDHFGYGYGKNWDDERVQNIKESLEENEKIVRSVMRAAFPSAASGSSMHPNTNEVDIDGQTFTFGAYYTIDTTSRNSSFRGSKTNHYFVKNGSGKTIASCTSSGRWNTPADAKNTCKIDVLRVLLKL